MAAVSAEPVFTANDEQGRFLEQQDHASACKPLGTVYRKMLGDSLCPAKLCANTEVRSGKKEVFITCIALAHKADLWVVSIKHSIVQEQLGVRLVNTKVHGQRSACPQLFLAFDKQALTLSKPSWLKLPVGIAVSSMLHLYWRQKRGVIMGSQRSACYSAADQRDGQARVQTILLRGIAIPT